MKSLIRNISFLILISLGFSSCIYDKYPDGLGDEGKIDINTTILFLNVKALNPSTMTTPAEKIKSVRVIITGHPAGEADSEGTVDGETPTAVVECNRLFEFPIVDAPNFSYTLTWSSNLGKKSVYVIANEESVDAGLTTALNRYKETESAGDLEQWLENYSFTPTYSTSGNSIYLPYTYSKTDFEPVAGQVNPVNCWLAPVATKFVFYFENKRDDPVKINGISMAYADTESYMMPRIPEESQEMELNGEMLYWPDWLAAVSQLSWDHPESGENEWFNQQYGWITDYSVPPTSQSRVFTFIEEDSSDTFYVPAATQVTADDGSIEKVPSSHTTPIFYLPESINYRSPVEASTPETADAGSEPQEQTYYLTMKIENTGTSQPPAFENMPIPNLKALFRNTFVVIQLIMGQGEIELYAEIAPWNRSISNGWVSEGNAPSNNPFSIKKK